MRKLGRSLDKVVLNNLLCLPKPTNDTIISAVCIMNVLTFLLSPSQLPNHRAAGVNPYFE